MKNFTIPFFGALLFILLFANCNSEKRAKPVPMGARNYVYAYTSGIISKAGPIQVRFTNKAITEDQIGEEVNSSVFNLSPAVAGKAIWKDDQTLVFEPEENMNSGQAYLATLALHKIFENVPKEAGVFEFDFKTKEQGFNVNVKNLQSEDGVNLEKQVLNGVLQTYDIADNQEVEKILEYEQKGIDLKIDWTHSGNGMVHQFKISGIKRGNNVSNVALNWNGNPMGVNEKGTKKVEVPGLDDFKIMKGQVVSEDGTYVLLHFSDPILKGQNLNGLINISNYNGNLDFVVDGNNIRVYPDGRLTGERNINVKPGIRNINNTKMQKSSVWSVSFTELQPMVRLVGNGVIMPNSEGLIFPFEAVSLKSVIVEVFKIYNNNILQFLQSNNMSGTYDMERVGRVILQEKVDLKRLNPGANMSNWSRYALDLSNLMTTDPEAIYQIRIGFKPEYSTYSCGGETTENNNEEWKVVEEIELDNNGEIKSFWGEWYGIMGQYDDYQWSHRDDPCKWAYYNYDRFVRGNIVASDIGITAKGGKDGSYFVAIADLKTANPIEGAQLEFYDYQQQLLKKTTTDKYGLAMVDLDRKPFVCIAKSGLQKGYLKMLDGNALSLSRYDVSGAISQKGLKGFIYGERGVWRPGDSLYLNFVLEDKSKKIPQNHPITFELYDSRGTLQEKRVTAQNTDQVYPLFVSTSADAPTGNWIAKVSIGGAKFDKVLKVETVKPNRLKIELDFGKATLSASDGNLKGDLQVNWLHGAPGQNLEAKVEVEVRQTNTTFDNFNNYEFDDPSRKMESEPTVIFDGNVDAIGHANFTANIYNSSLAAPGKLVAAFRTRAFEKGGDFSSNNQKIEYSPYPAYAGVNIPENKYGSKRLDIDKDGTIRFVALDEKGRVLRNRKLSIGLYRVEWRWWWDRGWDNLSRYNQSNHLSAQETTELTTNSKGEAMWSTKVSNWGRYLVRVCDVEGGHCSGDFFYAGYPWYDDNTSNRKEAAMMAFSSSKRKYEVGETIELKIPAGESGRVLITMETGTKVINSVWDEATKGDNTFSFEATPDMSPTVYAHVSLIQPHAQTDNDLPIRMYGVVPIQVENPKTILKPTLKMADELKPEQNFTVEIGEEKGQDMAYTIAVVDDGLLDLTNFKTPNPHDAFYAREALGVKTWDVYDDVLGAYGGELERILSIGGDGELGNAADKKNANRFKPVVMHLGPFYLKNGEKAKHEIKMPNYVGSVRTMVVAANSDGSYGKADKTTPVRKPLMVLATLPRVLGPTETLKLPVSVFAMDKKIKTVNVTIEEMSGLVKVEGSKSQSLSFTQPGESMVYFNLKVSQSVGIAKFKITAKGNGETATQEIELNVRNPNPYVTNVHAQTIQAGGTWEKDFLPVGMYGTNEGILEVSNIPPINLGERLNYLLRYPHGCIEQTTSSGFPQLYVDKLMDLNETQKQSVPRNIQATINRLKLFQTSDGGFSYWPGEPTASDWGSNYGGHFILEAKNLGYQLPSNMLNRWTKFQKKLARQWSYKIGGFRDNGSYNHNDLMQSYRLYTLALAGEPETGAMNRMRETDGISAQAKWRLAAAYALIGKPEIAKALINKLPTEIEKYAELGGSYGSDLRDQGMILETLTLMKDMNDAADLTKTVSEKLSSERWFSTQTTAYCLLAIGKFAENGFSDENLKFAFQFGGGKSTNAGSESPMMQVAIPVDEMKNRSLSVKNSNQGVLYARLILTGQPLIGDQSAASENLKIEVAYKATDGTRINPNQLEQGTDFIAEVTVHNPGTKGITYEEMALTQIFPSGWEILNTRMSNFTSLNNATRPEYQDIRDDRIYTYFDIKNNSRHVYRIHLNAAYEGRYYLPTVSCEAMYDNTINARMPGEWVEVLKVGEL
ncbi:MAG: MG2 domain-containing protein [Bacteroidetes bacterium]|nr:MG2 domain-containing protein [Bacteroidota bacterium]